MRYSKLMISEDILVRCILLIRDLLKYVFIKCSILTQNLASFQGYHPPQLRPTYAILLAPVLSQSHPYPISQDTSDSSPRPSKTCPEHQFPLLLKPHQRR